MVGNLETLLNNWMGELDRALQFTKPQQEKDSRKRLLYESELKKCRANLGEYKTQLGEGEPNEAQRLTMEHVEERIKQLERELA